MSSATFCPLSFWIHDFGFERWPSPPLADRMLVTGAGSKKDILSETWWGLTNSYVRHFSPRSLRIAHRVIVWLEETANDNKINGFSTFPSIWNSVLMVVTRYAIYVIWFHDNHNGNDNNSNDNNDSIYHHDNGNGNNNNNNNDGDNDGDKSGIFGWISECCKVKISSCIHPEINVNYGLYLYKQQFVNT